MSEFSHFQTVFYYSVAILALPISTFFTTKLLIFDRIYGPSDTTGNVYAAIGAVIMLHFALGLFVYRAYSGGEPERTREKPDKIE